MTTKHGFTAITSEGGLLPTDFLADLADPKANIDGLDPVTYRLAPGERIGEQVNRSWNRLKGCWTNFQRSIASKQPGDPTTTETRERWGLPLFQELDFGRLAAARAIEIDGKSYPVSHGWVSVPIHLVGSHVDLDRRTPGAVGAARMSPHSLVQQVLNASDDRMWGIISNGFTLRLLRDNVTLTRIAYIEWDLQTIFDGDLYPEFFLLWLVCHQSRFEVPPSARPDQCWLEKWKRQAKDKGLRALENLRPGVEKAIAELGAGLVSHKANQALRSKLSKGQLATQDLYRQILRVIYRMLFLSVAEDRGLLHPRLPKDEERKEVIDAALKARSRYRHFYSIGRLRDLTLQRAGTPHPDLWQVFQLVSSKLGSDTGCPDLALPALGSFLWSQEATPDLNDCLLSNRHFLQAVHSLAYVRGGDVRRTVDYKNLGSEELGSVYESLLELHPIVNGDTGMFELQTSAGHERKTSGSYYTHDSLVQCLLDSALEPVIAEVIKGKEGPAAADALLKLKFCDPAVGSGHFLIAAGHRLAKRVAAARTGEEEPSPEAVRTALRDVIGRCLYGVDINPMAAELCRVSLWLEALEPGKPLSFLDHHIRVGNSLLGATPELIAGGIPDDAFIAIEGDDKKVCSILKKRNRQEREGQRDMLHLMVAEPGAEYNSMASRTRGIDEAPDDTIDEIQRKAEQFSRLVVSPEYQHALHVADAWCAAFVWNKQASTPFEPVTTDTIHRLETDPKALTPAQRSEVERLSRQYQFFHWHLAFPEVFAKGGFDCVLGNPPWDKLTPDSKEFFSQYNEGVRFANHASENAIIEELLKDAQIQNAWVSHRRQRFCEVAFIKKSGLYQMFAPGNLGKGDLNTHRFFVELALSIVTQNGSVAQIVPEGLYNGANSTAIRKVLFGEFDLQMLYGFENAREVWFQGIDSRTKFCIYAARKTGKTQSFKATFNIRSPEELLLAGSGALSIPVSLVVEFSPDALSLLEFRSQRDIEISLRMYELQPKLGDESAGQPLHSQSTEIHMTNDADLFCEEANGFPLYEGRMIDQYDYRAKGYVSGRARAAVWDELEFGTEAKVIQPQWRIMPDKVPDKNRNRVSRYRIGYGWVASPTNERSLISALLPPNTIAGNSVPTIMYPPEYQWMYVLWLATANSFMMDFLVRMKVSLNLTFTLLNSLPFPRIREPNGLVRLLAPYVLELTCTGPEMSGFWTSMGELGLVPSVNVNVEAAGTNQLARRLAIRTLVDAIVAHDIFSIQRDELDYIMNTFPIVEEKDRAQFGDYRTKHLILSAFDGIQQRLNPNEVLARLLKSAETGTTA